MSFDDFQVTPLCQLPQLQHQEQPQQQQHQQLLHINIQRNFPNQVDRSSASTSGTASSDSSTSADPAYGEAYAAADRMIPSVVDDVASRKTPVEFPDYEILLDEHHEPQLDSHHTPPRWHHRSITSPCHVGNSSVDAVVVCSY